MKRNSTQSMIKSFYDVGISKSIILMSIFLTIVGTLFVNSAKAQCSLSTATDVGTSPFMRVATPTSSAITTTTATLTDVWGAWNSMFPATVTIEYGTTSGTYTSTVTYTQAAYNSGTGTVVPAGGGTFTACNCSAASSTGTFNANLTGLASSTQYFYRARINVGASCYYSAEQNFTTLNAGPFTITTTAASSVTATGASTGGNITQLGAVTVTQRGVAYGTTTNPTTAGTKTNDGSGAGAFTSSLSGLTPSTTYYVRAYAIGSDGLTYYGPNQSFITLAPFTITTTAASSIAATTASTGGNITVNGGITVTSRGVAYGTSTNPTTAGTKTINGSGGGAFTSSLTGLTSSTTYYVRAYAVGSDGITYYGPQQSFITLFQVSGTVSPFSLTPAWYWGYQAKYTFPSGSFPAVPPGPTIGTAPTLVAYPETSTSISFRSGGVAVYTNSMKVWNSSDAQLKAFDAAGEMTCAGSSTGGAVSFPDPANNATNDAFYVVLGNDMTGGACAGNGVNQYRISGTAPTMSTVSAKTATPMEAANFATEAITAGTDGNGGYWVVVHDKNATNKFRVWHYTASGVSGPTEYEPATTASITTTTSSGYLKFSPCMNMLAFGGFGDNAITIYNFDRTTGAVGTQIAAKTGVGTSGLEFSPDGTKIFYSAQGQPVSWFLISNPATGGSIAGSNSWTMQMGPDAQIYTSGVGSLPATFGTANVGRITDPNGAMTYTNMTLSGSSLSYRGLSNLAWLSPQTPSIAETKSGCDVTFKYSFLNYFNDTVTTNSPEWSWDNGATWTAGTNAQTHSFSTNNYNIKVRFKDTYCSQTWTQSLSGTCVLPVDWLNVSASPAGRNIIVKWSTTSEKNNAYFVIERSLDGQHFNEIGRVSGSLNSSTVNQYQFIDKNPDTGENYYRIIQYDLNNASSYSNIVAASMNNNFTIVIAPNPSQNDFELRISGSDGEALVLVTDILGRELYNSTISDFNSVHFGSNFAKGTYLVKVISGQNSTTQKIIKE